MPRSTTPHKDTEANDDMTNILILSDTENSPELRHEVPLGVPDPFLYAEVDSTRHVVIPHMEIPRLVELGLPIELHPTEEFGGEELRQQGLEPDDVQDRVVVRFCEQHGLKQAVVPATFPVRTADALRAAGIALTPQQKVFSDRRRAKTSAQLAGIRRAQQAASAGMAEVADMILRAQPQDGKAVVDGEPLTSERLRHALLLTFFQHDATADEVIVSHGPQAAIAHETGSGTILPGESIVVDIWPRDTISSCHTDMTRTFVVGEPPAQLVEWHRVVQEAQAAALAAVRPGMPARTIYDRACEVVERAGHPTGRTKEPGRPLDHGFFHGLGHGVGLQAHEAPMLGLAATNELIEGDVITIEPGIYYPGIGGCRLEDTIMVTDSGAEDFTNFPYDLTP